jgi:hypothetical protein
MRRTRIFLSYKLESFCKFLSLPHRFPFCSYLKLCYDVLWCGSLILV